MKAYRLTIAEKEADPIAMISSYQSKWIERHEYYLNKSLAEARENQIKSAIETVGLSLFNVRTSIIEIDIKE